MCLLTRTFTRPFGYEQKLLTRHAGLLGKLIPYSAAHEWGSRRRYPESPSPRVVCFDDLRPVCLPLSTSAGQDMPMTMMAVSGDGALHMELWYLFLVVRWGRVACRYQVCGFASA